MSVIVRCPQLRGFHYISSRHGMCNPAVPDCIIQNFPRGICPQTPLVVGRLTHATIILLPTPTPSPNSKSCMKPWFGSQCLDRHYKDCLKPKCKSTCLDILHMINSLPYHFAIKNWCSDVEQAYMVSHREDTLISSSSSFLPG